jgi:hypothetical protein
MLSTDLATQADTMTAIPWLLCHSEDIMILNELLAILLAAVLDNSRMDQLGKSCAHEQPKTLDLHLRRCL